MNCRRGLALPLRGGRKTVGQWEDRISAKGHDARALNDTLSAAWRYGVTLTYGGM
jgi:hypothetical protein